MDHQKPPRPQSPIAPRTFATKAVFHFKPSDEIRDTAKGTAPMKSRTLCIACLAALLASIISTNTATAQQNTQQNRGGIKRIPPAGVAVPDNDRTELQTGVEQLSKEIADLPSPSPAARDARSAPRTCRSSTTPFAMHSLRRILQHRRNLKAKVLLKEGLDRAASLRSGKAPWTKSTGLIVRGYVSRIDGSVQPYGLVVPPTFAEDPSRPRRLDIWYHGRGETSAKSISSPIAKIPRRIHPDDTIVLHPYGASATPIVSRRSRYVRSIGKPKETLRRR